MSGILPMSGTQTTTDDVRLAAACAAGDTTVFEEIYRRFGDRMKSGLTP